MYSGDASWGHVCTFRGGSDTDRLVLFDCCVFYSSIDCGVCTESLPTIWFSQICNTIGVSANSLNRSNELEIRIVVSGEYDFEHESNA